VSLRVVVSDTSPLRALAHLEHVNWLEAMFQRVLVPPAVVLELRNPPVSYRPVDISIWPFLEMRSPRDLGRVEELRSMLDAGEAEAIALAEELRAEVVLVDELAGREVAHRCGFTVLGTLGVLVRAKERGFLSAVAPLLDRLRSELNFHVSVDLRRRILEQVGETP
jgi:predicted nucleic acid-binding protein